MNKLDEIRDKLEEYQREALIEYSPLETARHIHFSHNGVDGSHPEAIKFWRDELQAHVGSGEKKVPKEKLIQDILARTTPELQVYFDALDEKDRNLFRLLLLKIEGRILSMDYTRAKEYFDLEYQIEEKKSKEMVEHLLKTMNENARIVPPAVSETEEVLLERQKEKLRKKTKFELFEEYMASPLIQNRKNEQDKIRLSITTLLQSSKQKYLIDYELNDYDVFFETLLYTPASINKLKKIFDDYDENFVAIAEDFKNDQIEETYHYNTLEIQSKKTLVEKLAAVKNFLTYCVEEAMSLEKNVLTMRRYDTNRFNNIAKDSKDRYPFNAEELNKMIQLMRDQDMYYDLSNFYIILIALFTGMRVEEICKLELIDIIREDDIDCINIRGKVKTTNSLRKVPIHPFLIDKFDFLKYVEFAKKNSNNEMLFKVKPKILKSKTIYSHDFVQEFMEFRNEFVSENRIIENLISFHSFRHSFASRLDENGVRESDVSRLMGHNIKGSETSRYTHSTVKKLYSAVKLLKIDDIEKSLISLSAHFKKEIKL